MHWLGAVEERLRRVRSKVSDSEQRMLPRNLWKEYSTLATEALREINSRLLNNKGEIVYAENFPITDPTVCRWRLDWSHPKNNGAPLCVIRVALIKKSRSRGLGFSIMGLDVADEFHAPLNGEALERAMERFLRRAIAADPSAFPINNRGGKSALV